jgi:hypothetical protein
MHRVGLIVGFLAATLPAPAMATDWVLVGVSRGKVGAKFYVDLQSTRTMSNGYKRANELTIYDHSADGQASSNRALYEFDCSGARLRSVEIAFFKGSRITNVINEPTEWDFVYPETRENLMLNLVCFGKR